MKTTRYELRASDVHFQINIYQERIQLNTGIDYTSNYRTQLKYYVLIDLIAYTSIKSQ